MRLRCVHTRALQPTNLTTLIIQRHHNPEPCSHNCKCKPADCLTENIS